MAPAFYISLQTKKKSNIQIYFDSFRITTEMSVVNNVYKSRIKLKKSHLCLFISDFVEITGYKSVRGIDISGAKWKQNTAER